MQKFLLMKDFGGQGIIPLFSAVVTAIPFFFPAILFAFWLLGTASSYFTMLKLTGKKRFWNALVSMSFVMFLASLIISAQNTATTTFLSGYWIGFYILATVGSWMLLDRYK